jgi:hypothetical protein
MYFTPEPSDLNEKKATQAAARFLAASSKRMHYLKLLKLMYLADREALLSGRIRIKLRSRATFPASPRSE